MIKTIFKVLHTFVNTTSSMVLTSFVYRVKLIFKAPESIRNVGRETLENTFQSMAEYATAGQVQSELSISE